MPDVDAAAAFVPPELGVSGDFYLLTNGPDGSAVAIVGDVVGHGPEAARLATFVRARIAAFAASTSDPAELLTLANTALVDRPGPGEELVTAVCLRYLAAEERISWAIAGHPPPLRLSELEELPAGSAAFPLGAEPGLALTTAEASLASGDGVLIYTDGATDDARARSCSASRASPASSRHSPRCPPGQWPARSSRRSSPGRTSRSATTSASWS